MVLEVSDECYYLCPAFSERVSNAEKGPFV